MKVELKNGRHPQNIVHPVKIFVFFLLFTYLDVQSQTNTGLPVIRIDVEFGAEVANREDYQNMTFVLTDPNNPAHNVSKTEMTDLIRGRGHSTWSGAQEQGGLEWKPDKKPYRIKFDKKTSLFGLPAAKSWVLLANWYDPTLLKNAFAFELADRLEIRFNHTYHHVDLYLNGIYRGNYLLTEHNQVGKGRVDINETEGWLVKMDFHYDDEPKFRTTNYNLPVMISSPEFEPATMDNPKYKFVETDLDQLCDLMAAADFPENGYRDLIDMESIVKYFMVATITGIGDFTNPGSVYFYRDKGGKICGGPLWDFDINFGFSWINEPIYIFGVNVPNVDYPANRYPFPGSIRSPQRQFFLRFSEDPVFVAKWKEIWNRHFNDISSMSQFIDDMANKIRKSAIENYKVSWLDYPVVSPRDFDYWIGELKFFVNERIKYLDQQYKEPMTYPSSINFGTEIVGYSDIPAKTINLIGKTADLGGSVTAQLEEADRLAFEISNSKLTPTNIGNGESMVSVNINPKKSLPASTYNEVSVAFYYSNGNKWKTVPLMFTVFQPALNDATLKSLTVSSGKLSPTFDTNVTEYAVKVDNNVTNITVTGVATNYIGATVNGNVTNYPLNVGANTINITVTAQNGTTTKTYKVTVIRDTPTKKIYVNEISGNNKWLELYNDENEAVNLTGYEIRKIDDAGVSTNWTIPFGTTIPAKGFKVWTQNVGDGFTWGITAQRDVAFKLLDDKGRELDFFEVKMSNNLYSQGNNRTVGRQTDGHPKLIIFLDDGTKGSSNNLGTPEPILPPTNVMELFTSHLTVYPNPFTGEVYIKGAEGCMLQVLSIDGAVVHTQKITNPYEIIRLENLSSSIYIFQIIKNGKAGSVKVIKN